VNNFYEKALFSTENFWADLFRPFRTLGFGSLCSQKTNIAAQARRVESVQPDAQELDRAVA